MLQVPVLSSWKVSKRKMLIQGCEAELGEQFLGLPHWNRRTVGELRGLWPVWPGLG